MPRGCDDEILHDRLVAGDQRALTELFELNRERLRRLVGFRLDRRLYGRVDPDDVLQEGYLAAAQRLQHYGSESSTPHGPFLWLRMVMKQTLIDVHRQHLGAKMRDADREVALAGGGYSQTTSVSLARKLLGRLTSPSLAAARAEIREQVEQALGAMEPHDQEVLALRHFEELTNKEIAAELGIQQKAASIRYVRAIRRLKDIISRFPTLLDEAGEEA